MSRAPGGEYLVSVSDMMAGLIFIFIITLMVFVLRFQSVTQQAQSAEETRTLILELLEQKLDSALPEMQVELDTDQGILRLTGSAVEFGVGASEPRREYWGRVVTLGSIMADVLPCFLPDRGAAFGLPCQAVVADTLEYGGLLEAVLIEGHTDSLGVSLGTARFRDNVELSGLRAAAIHRILRDSVPRVDSLRNSAGQRILSISGYGSERLIPQLDPLDDRQRRIDIRFLMDQPRRPEPADSVEGRLPESGA